MRPVSVGALFIDRDRNPVVTTVAHIERPEDDWRPGRAVHCDADRPTDYSPLVGSLRERTPVDTDIGGSTNEQYLDVGSDACTVYPNRWVDVDAVTPVTAIPAIPEEPTRVWKRGAASDVTTGTLHPVIESFVADNKYYYAEAYLIEGDDEPFAMKGDSGSIVYLDADDQPIGMVVAVERGTNNAFCVSLIQISDELGLSTS